MHSSSCACHTSVLESTERLNACTQPSENDKRIGKAHITLLIAAGTACSSHNGKTEHHGIQLRICSIHISSSTAVLIARYKKMLDCLDCVIFKQADCHIVAMRRFVENDALTLSEEGEDVNVFIYSHNQDNVLGLSQAGSLQCPTASDAVPCSALTHCANPMSSCHHVIHCLHEPGGGIR